MKARDSPLPLCAACESLQARKCVTRWFSGWPSAFLFALLSEGMNCPSVSLLHRVAHYRPKPPCLSNHQGVSVELPRGFLLSLQWEGREDAGVGVHLAGPCGYTCVVPSASSTRLQNRQVLSIPAFSPHLCCPLYVTH